MTNGNGGNVSDLVMILFLIIKALKINKKL